MKKIRKIAIITILLLIFICKLFEFVSGTPAENIEITNTNICTTNIMEISKGTASFCGKEFNNSTGQLYICGKVLASGKVFYPALYVYKSDDSYPFWDSTIKVQENGEFCNTFSLPPNNRIGEYVIKIYYHRYMVASASFIIR
jgi:hypothetical protein